MQTTLEAKHAAAGDQHLAFVSHEHATLEATLEAAGDQHLAFVSREHATLDALHAAGVTAAEHEHGLEA